MSAPIAVAPTWHVVGPGRVQAQVMSEPDVVLEVVGHTEAVERRIWARIPHWREPILPLRRALMPPGPRAFAQSKLLVWDEWRSEHCAWGEPAVLEEIFRKPHMTRTELAALKVKQERMRIEARERHAKLLEERRNALARKQPWRRLDD